MENKMNFKELVRVYDYSDYKEDREHETLVSINGRDYVKLGQHTATTVVGNLYKFDVPSNEPFKYVLCIGIARQHPNDFKINHEDGLENANINANISPVMTIKLMNPICYETFKCFAKNYIDTLPYEFVRTPKEVQLIKNI